VKIVNSNDIAELRWDSPGGRFLGFGKQLSEALGRDRTSSDALLRHPFDVELARVPAGATPCPYHSHSAQWEFYHVVSGSGRVRHAAGETAIKPGDAFLFKPNEPHQLFADDAADLVILVVADNPIGESCHYPDSNKWAVGCGGPMLRGETLDYYDGEE